MGEPLWARRPRPAPVPAEATVGPLCEQEARDRITVDVLVAYDDQPAQRRRLCRAAGVRDDGARGALPR